MYPAYKYVYVYIYPMYMYTYIYILPIYIYLIYIYVHTPYIYICVYRTLLAVRIIQTNTSAVRIFQNHVNPFTSLFYLPAIE